MQNNRLIGAKAEELAGNFLKSLGFEIVRRNFRCQFGEIDIIARDKDYFVFIEVKYRKNLKYGYPGEAVSKSKQKTIRDVALFYIQCNDLTDSNFRFDVIEILGDEISHIINAF